MSEKHTTKVPLSPMLRAALATRQPGEDLDEALLRALKAAHPEHATAVLSAATQMIEMEMKAAREDREQVVQRLAAADPGPELTFVTFGAGPLHMNFESMVFVPRLGDKGFQSLDELPPDVRRAIEERWGQGEKAGLLLNELPADIRRTIEEQLGRGEKVRLAPDDLPPDARRAIEARLGRGEKVRVVRGAGSARTGCSMALLVALWRLVWR